MSADEEVYVVWYLDDGQKGIGPQDMRTTSPRRELHIFGGYDQAQQFMKDFLEGLESWSKVRLNPRVMAEKLELKDHRV